MRREGEDVFEPETTTPEPKPWRLPWDARYDAEHVIAALEPWVGERRAAKIRDVVAQRVQSVVVVLDSPRDPHNGAAVLRTSEAFGLLELHVIPSVEPFLASRRVARGTERWLDVVRHTDPEHAAVSLEKRGFELVATHPAGELAPEDLVAIPRLALVFGNEHLGISEPIARRCRRSVRVPMRGFVESLNVSVTAAILLWAATRGRPGDLSEADRRLLYARGLWRSVPRARDVVAARTVT